MKDILSKIIFGELIIREYVTVFTTDDQINERVYLQTDARMIDISLNHWLLCLDPVVFGIWIPSEANISPLSFQSVFKIYVADSDSDIKKSRSCLLSVLTLEYIDKIEEEDGVFLLLKPVKCGIRYLNYLKILLIYFNHYKKPGLSLSKFKFLVSSFSYPRKVRLVSFGKEKEDYNIFPMDFAGDIASSGRFVFGLRHTNRSMPGIISAKKLVVSDCSSEYRSIIYELGKHHLATPSTPDTLPFKILETGQFGFYVPEWVDSYREIRIDKTMNLGSHMLFWGKSINEKKMRVSDAHLYHIHFLLYFHQKRKGSTYPTAPD